MRKPAATPAFLFLARRTRASAWRFNLALHGRGRLTTSRDAHRQTDTERRPRPEARAGDIPRARQSADQASEACQHLCFGNDLACDDRRKRRPFLVQEFNESIEVG